MNERALVAKLARHSPKIGDDCAVIPNGRADLLVTADQYIEDVHFRRRTHPARIVGWNAAARGLSDIAAMGGDPKFVFVSVALPAWANARFVDGFFSGVREHGVELAGGDLSHADKLYCDVTALGSVPRGKAVLRSGARPGDLVYVSGPLGRPKRRIVPRLDLAKLIQRSASACMDLSDGLSLDLARLCDASNCGAELAGIPVARGATLEQALHGGEDYELLFTSSRRLDFPAIGTVVAKRGVRLQGRPVPAKGYDHFSK